LHLQTGTPPRLRMTGQLRELDAPALTEEQVRQYIRSVGPRHVIDDIDAAMSRGHDFAYAAPGLARFRANLYSHMGKPGLVFRVILPKIRTLDDLHLPPVVREIA